MRYLDLFALSWISCFFACDLGVVLGSGDDGLLRFGSPHFSSACTAAALHADIRPDLTLPSSYRNTSQV